MRLYSSDILVSDRGIVGIYATDVVINNPVTQMFAKNNHIGMNIHSFGDILYPYSQFKILQLNSEDCYQIVQ